MANFKFDVKLSKNLTQTKHILDQLPFPNFETVCNNWLSCHLKRLSNPLLEIEESWMKTSNKHIFKTFNDKTWWRLRKSSKFVLWVPENFFWGPLSDQKKKTEVWKWKNAKETSSSFVPESFIYISLILSMIWSIEKRVNALNWCFWWTIPSFRVLRNWSSLPEWVAMPAWSAKWRFLI